jgi:hypothetical protein
MPYGFIFEVLKLADGTPAAMTVTDFRCASALEIGAVNAIEILAVILELVADVSKRRLMCVSVGHKAIPP